MSTQASSDPATLACAERFMNLFTALRGHIATRSVINYPPGLSANQIKMMHLIFHRPGISQTHIAERLGVTTASISNSVRELEAQGLIERHPNPHDARAMLLQLAPYGEEVFEEISSSFTNTIADLLSVLPVEDQQELVDRLEAMLTANHINLESEKLNYADKICVMKEQR